MTERKAITIYGLSHAKAAAKVAAKLSTPVTVVSAPAAVASAGPAWFLSVVTQAQRVHLNADIQPILDCANFGGLALASMRQGLKLIIYDGVANNAVDNIAKQYSAKVIRTRPDSLDARLAETDRSLEEALREWLSG